MKKLRILLYPFSVLYHLITAIRNKLFDVGILSQKKFDIPIIGVGNLNTGGTGKTPHTAYIAKLLQSQNYKVATLSRGYGRKSKGYILATKKISAETLGDEPYELYHSLKNTHVAVCENRITGIEQLQKTIQPDIIILDDNIQHRYVKPSFQILLTTYDRLFYNDYILPAGNLRESRNGASRANAIIITKCPEGLTEAEKEKLKTSLYKYSKAPVFFSTYIYGELKYNNTQTTTKDIILLTGIANTEYLKTYIQKHYHIIEHLKYPDHYNYTQQEINTWREKYQTAFANGSIIITTAKDAARLQALNTTDLPIAVLPVEVDFGEDGKEFGELLMRHYK
ncbi:MAG: tetraacyldisaccharide 4'-kinase [Bacteroidota bacterium]|nr:tetraacyldisaccharide 4'-kinase [Bacteroidota bacterium]